MDETIELEDETPTALLRRQLAVGVVIVAVIALTLVAAAALGAMSMCGIRTRPSVG